MLFRSWFAQLQLARTFQRLQREWRRSPHRRQESHFYGPAEVLAVRTLLSAALPYPTATNASQLVADINAANKAGGTNTITLAANTSFDLTAVNNTTNGANGLPFIGSNKAVNLTIVGNGDTIERSTAAGTPAFRLLDVAKGSSLTLESVTLQNGLAQGSGAAADGGAIYNQGSLTLIGVTVQNNAAEGTSGANGVVTGKKSQLSSSNGQAGSDAAGGGIWSSGSATLEGGTILQQNEALGGQGGAAGAFVSAHLDIAGDGGAGGGGLGGGLYEAGGSVNITGATLTDNTAAGGTGGGGFDTSGGGSWEFSNSPSGSGGVGAGGGLYTATGTLNISSVAVQANQALGGTGGATNDASQNGGDPGWGVPEVPGNGGVAYGGGIDVAGGTTSLAGTELLSNVARGGTGGFDRFYSGNGGNAFGGGIEIASLASVSLDSFTVTNTINNDVVNGYGVGGISNIDGTYILLT